MRVLVSCDPPILGEVLSLAVSALDGVELTRLGEAAPDLVLATTLKSGPPTIMVDATSTLPGLLAQLTALISQGQASANPLEFTQLELNTSDAGRNPPSGMASNHQIKRYIGNGDIDNRRTDD